MTETQGNAGNQQTPPLSRMLFALLKKGTKTWPRLNLSSANSSNLFSSDKELISYVYNNLNIV